MSILQLSEFDSVESIAEATNTLESWCEEKLVASAKSGQRAAFGELCRRQTKKIFSVAHRITRNREDAEDAVQDSFLSAFLHLNDFDERSRFATWLTRIAINAALAKLRKKRGIREVAMDEPDPATELRTHYEVQDRAPNPEETFRLNERKAVVTAAIGELRSRTRKVVEFHHLQEHTLKETAQLLGISTAAAKARMFHARAALRRTLLPKGTGRSSWANAS